MIVRALIAAVALFASNAACSAVHGVYEQPGYNVKGPNPIKRIGITAWAPSDEKGLADTLTAVATDLVKLRKNYLVYNTQAASKSFSDMCKDKIEGVLMVRTLGVKHQANDVHLDVALELYRCSDGALLWMADGGLSEASNDDNLTKLTDNYATSVGDAAKVFAAPAFSLLQQLIAVLPDPQLTDDDISEKIELGAQPLNLRPAAPT